MDETESHSHGGTLDHDMLWQATLLAEAPSSTPVSSEAGKEQAEESFQPLRWQPLAFPKRRVAQLSCGKTHTLLLDCSGEVWAWGRGAFGQLGHGVAQDEQSPRFVVRVSGETEREREREVERERSRERSRGRERACVCVCV